VVYTHSHSDHYVRVCHRGQPDGASRPVPVRYAAAAQRPWKRRHRSGQVGLAGCARRFVDRAHRLD
jgi:hypothetical protein